MRSMDAGSMRRSSARLSPWRMRFFMFVGVSAFSSMASRSLFRVWGRRMHKFREWLLCHEQPERVWFCLPMLTLSNALAVAMLSDPGRVRRHNEDACAADVECGAFVVCDGVGGA